MLCTPNWNWLNRIGRRIVVRRNEFAGDRAVSEYRIRPYECRDKEAVAELQQYLWGGDVARNAAYFEWKYEKNPYIHEPLLYLTLQGEKIVGMRGAFGSRWILPGSTTPVTIPHTDDLVVHPAHRGGGLHHLIMVEALCDLARRGFDYVISLSAIPVAAVAFLRMEWRDGGSFRPLRRRTAPKALLDRSSEILGKLPLVWRYADRIAKQRLLRPPRLFDSGRAESTSGRAQSDAATIPDDQLAAMAELAARIPRGPKIRHVHDVQYLRWRYANPLCEYRCLSPRSGLSDSYLVVQRALGTRTDPLRINIADWEASDPAMRLSMLDEFLAHERCHELWCWGLTVPPEIEQGMRQRGFSDVPLHPELQRQTSLLIRGLGNAAGQQEYVLSGARLDEVANWDVRMIDSMVC